MSLPDSGTLTLIVIIAVLALALISLLAAMTYSARLQRLPAAAAWVDIHERLASATHLLEERKAELRAAEQMIHDRDRFAAEVAAIRDQLDRLQAELANLAPARAEIEQVKAEAAAAAALKASAEQNLATLRAEADRLRTELDPDRVARLREVAERLTGERDAVAAQLPPLQAERDTALRTIAEARAQEARLAALDQREQGASAELEALQNRLARLAVDLEQMLETRDAAAQEAGREKDAVNVARREREALSADMQRLTAEKTSLMGDIDTLETLRDRIRKEIEGLDGSGRTAEGTRAVPPEQQADLVKDLVTAPACLGTPAVLRGQPQTEAEALHQVQAYLGRSGLRFAPRTLRAFHTALKINDTAQITVLAGVSGTGKSLLPRRYAEAMGMHFLPIAVEPRWDSPQDLLGFYNYVEKKYRATELARLLANLDPWQSLALQPGTPDRRDHMAIVLLDEMNLARVEYYFSEFLSRLEARPAWTDNLTQKAAKDALIPVDIRGLDQTPMLFPAHNILFVGTMNDDESTQSLSDKVLDRGNVLQFPAPAKFTSASTAQPAPPDQARSFSQWRHWIKGPEAMDDSARTLVSDTVTGLAGIMQRFGRPFGHRLARSIEAYAVNYPHEGNGGPDLRVPLADQIEFRILPKLRGIEIDNSRPAFDELARLVSVQLQDGQLGQRIEALRNEQAQAAGLFVWRGLDRDG